MSKANVLMMFSNIGPADHHKTLVGPVGKYGWFAQICTLTPPHEVWQNVYVSQLKSLA
jgi:hypothetical protein